MNILAFAAAETHPYSALMLGSTMLIAGCLGGLLSWLLSRASRIRDLRAARVKAQRTRNARDSQPEIPHPLRPTLPAGGAILQGIVAAGVVPLFLALTGSGLVEDLLDASGWTGGHFHFLGLCLLAALGAPAFLDRVSSSALGAALTESAGARKAAERAHQEAREVTEALLAGDTVETSSEEVLQEVAYRELLGKEEKEVFRELSGPGSRKFFTESALRERTHLAPSALTEALRKLRDAAFVSSINTQGTTAWYLTRKGQGLERFREDESPTEPSTQEKRLQ